jgi:ethanolamine utilization protein EutQ (cupin superfamily)
MLDYQQVVDILAMVNFDMNEARDILKQNNQLKVSVINMANPAQVYTWDLEANQDGYQIMEGLLKMYNPA